MLDRHRQTPYRTDVTLEPGLTADVRHTVTDSDTAIALASGDVPVLATPRLIALCEEASVTCLVGRLDEGTTTVGMRVNLDHVAPTAVGNEVTATATLERVEGRRLTFVVTASDANGTIGTGRVVRVMVDRERFMERVSNPG